MGDGGMGEAGGGGVTGQLRQSSVALDYNARGIDVFF